MNSDPTEGTWHQRTVDLSSFAGKTVDKLWIAAGSGTPVGNWVILYGDIAIVHPDGTVTTPRIAKPGDRAKSESFSYWSGGGETNTQAWIEHKTTSGNQPAVTTSYYLADQIGSTRMVLSAGGWPVARGTYYPFGVEIGSSASPNHYKFSGKDRDQASGLDDFGARYYSAVVGRFMTPDWSASPEPVPYAKLDNPQSLNLYSYVLNNPLTGIDADGHCGNGLVGNELTPGGPKPKKDPCPSVAKTKVAAEHLSNAVNDFVSSAGVAKALGKVGTFSSGAADLMTLGLTKKINEMDGGAEYIDYKSKTYTAGKITGVALAIGTVAADISTVQSGKLFGTRLAGNKPLLNSSSTLRIGWSYSKSSRQYVFRIGGKAVGAIKENPHINLWPPSWWTK